MTADRSIDALVRVFAKVLARSWPDVEATSQQVATGSYVEDWMQANWEMIVEAALPPREVFLEVYGEGADCNDRSSRVFNPEATPTHAVICVAATDDGIVEDILNHERFLLGAEGLPLEEFVTIDEGWFVRKPPFDCVLLLHDGHERVVSANAVCFALGTATRG